MPKYLLVEIADDGTASVTEVTDPAVVTGPISIPLASLFPTPAEPAPVAE